MNPNEKECDNRQEEKGRLRKENDSLKKGGIDEIWTN